MKNKIFTEHHVYRCVMWTPIYRNRIEQIMRELFWSHYLRGLAQLGNGLY